MKQLVTALLFALMLTDSAWAQTAADLNEGTRLTYDPVNQIGSFSWWGRAGRTYFIQQSPDLIEWHYVPVIRSGQDDVIQWSFPGNANKWFLRLTYTDIATSDPLGDDFDGDGIANMDEFPLGTSPLNQDTDADRVDDFVEILIGSDPTVTDDLTIYYVSTAGSDSNPGTQAQPFATIARALQAASGPTAVYLAAGTYVGLTDVLTGSVALLGEASEHPVVLTQAVNGTPFVQTVLFADANGDGRLQSKLESVWVDSGTTVGMFDAADMVLSDPSTSLVLDVLGTALTDVLFADTNANGVYDSGESVYRDDGAQAGIYDSNDGVLDNGRAILNVSAVDQLYLYNLKFSGPSSGIKLVTATNVFAKATVFSGTALAAVEVESSRTIELSEVRTNSWGAVRWSGDSGVTIHKMESAE